MKITNILGFSHWLSGDQENKKLDRRDSNLLSKEHPPPKKKSGGLVGDLDFQLISSEF